MAAIGHSQWVANARQALKMKTLDTGGKFGFNFNSKMGLSTIVVCMMIGAQVFSSLLGMHRATWTTSSATGAISTAAMAAVTMTSLEMWGFLCGRTLELIEHILVDTAQACFCLVR